MHDRSSEQIEIILEKRHLLFLGISGLLVCGFFFGLGVLADRYFWEAPLRGELQALQSVESINPGEEPPLLLTDRSNSPSVEARDFEFYENLSRKSGQGGKEKASQQKKKEVEKPVVIPVDKPAQQEVAQAKPKREPKKPPYKKPVRLALQADRHGVFALQVVSLSEKSAAEDYRKRLAGKGYPVQIESALLPGNKKVYRVKVGNYNSQERAQQVAKMLQSELGKEVWIHRIAQG